MTRFKYRIYFCGIEVLLTAIQAVSAYLHNVDIWMDVGKTPQLEQAEGVLEISAEAVVYLS